MIDYNIRPPGEGDVIDAGFLEDLCETIRSLASLLGMGENNGLELTQDGRQFKVSDRVRYQLRTGLVKTAAAAATRSAGKITAEFGEMVLYLPSDYTPGDPPTLKFAPETRAADQYLPFYSLNCDRGSTPSGKDGLFTWTPQGWQWVGGQC